MKNMVNLKSDEIYQLKITLLGTKPPIWRRLIVEPETRLSDLHKILQSVMGWTNAHLHQFRRGDECYADPTHDQFSEPVSVDYRKLRLQSLLKTEKEKIFYDYDFGDGWEHSIVLEKKIPRESVTAIPLCTGGKRNCPPEDCGGVPGFYNLLDIISDTGHEEHDDLLEWLDGEYDPEHFDIDEVNLLLRQKNYGCIDLTD